MASVIFRRVEISGQRRERYHFSRDAFSLLGMHENSYIFILKHLGSNSSLSLEWVMSENASRMRERIMDASISRTYTALFECGTHNVRSKAKDISSLNAKFVFRVSKGETASNVGARASPPCHWQSCQLLNYFGETIVSSPCATAKGEK